MEVAARLSAQRYPLAICYCVWPREWFETTLFGCYRGKSTW